MIQIKYAVSVLALAGCLCATLARGAVVVAFYGDDDGFGFSTPITSGALSDNPSNVNNAGPGEAPLTDCGLIFFDNGMCGANPAFQPSGGFNFSLDGQPIISATLTARFGAFDPIPPITSPNMLVLDGVDISASFFPLFTDKSGAEGPANNAVETVSVNLDASLFPLLADGSVSLAGTRITEGIGSGSFLVDFLSLTIQTGVASVAEPATLALFGLALAGLSFSRRKRVAR